jgi:NADPH-dependent glutamate synthase beta subunit-like oxidoreductase/2,4-dienoyl-CoA reductase-like NADH-dependent reductase (Old Yellow Enzyme family)
MAVHERFRIGSLQDLSEEAARLRVELPHQADTSLLLESVRIGTCRTPNRFAVHPMEGFDADPKGAPQELTFRRYGRYAAGRAGLIWFEATAIMEEGRSNPRQLWINKNSIDIFKQLVDFTRDMAYKSHGPDHTPVLVLQLTHSGRYSRPKGKPAPLIAHRSPYLDPLHELPEDYPPVTDEYLDGLQERFVEAAMLAAKAGFDGVDIKSCHRYLVSELLASFSRPDSKYGGSFENRTRFLVETAGRIRREVPELFVTTRLNAYDAIPYPYGWGVAEAGELRPDLTEPLKLIKALHEDVGIPVLNLSIGNPYYRPHFGRPFDFPSKDVALPEMHPLENVGQFISIVRDIQQANPGLPVIGAGYSWLRQFLPNVAAAVVAKGWATLIGQGRNSFAYPDSVNDLAETGKFNKDKVCITCSACTQIMRDGGSTGCVVRDSEIYAEIYQRGRRTARETLEAEAQRCRDCANPTCRKACPADVDVPGFIKAFAEGDIEKSYALLREKNKFPELCAHICPTEIQCEGGCIDRLLDRGPIPIHEIQKFVASTAREQGLVPVELGEPTGKRMAVIGAGPAGLACAARLLEIGHTVDLYDLHNEPGGTPGEIIPAYRLSRQEALQEIYAILEKAEKSNRLRNRYGAGLTIKQPLDKIKAEYDAVFVGIGLGREITLPGADRNVKGVVGAMTFLKEVKTEGVYPVPDSVCIVGGGNTAIDAAITAKQMGARDVFVVYRRSFSEMPAWPQERDKALTAGVQFLILSQPTGYVVEEGKLVGLKVARAMLGEPDESGRRGSIVLPDSECVIPTQLVIEALGQAPLANLGILLPDVRCDYSGRVIVDHDTMATSVPGVYAGGDIVNGGATAVEAVAHGMRAAQHMGRH